jgi:ATP-binding cassette subfamily B protein
MSVSPRPLHLDLARFEPFSHLPASTLAQVAQGGQLLRYRVGQALARPEALPQIVVLLEGQARLLGENPDGIGPMTLAKLERGAVIGIVGVLRGQGCETVIASSDAIALSLSSVTVQQWMQTHPAFREAVQGTLYPAEVHALLLQQITQQAVTPGDLKAISQQAWETGQVHYLPLGKSDISALDPQRQWFLSSGTVLNLPQGSRVDPKTTPSLETLSPQGARLVGILPPIAPTIPTAEPATVQAPPGQNGSGQNGSGQNGSGQHSHGPERFDPDAIPYAPDHLPEPEPEPSDAKRDYPVIRARGELGGLLACLEMVSKYFELPAFKRDVIRRILVNQQERLGQLSIALSGKVAEFMGLKTQMTTVPSSVLSRLPTPAIIRWQEGFAVLYESTAKTRVLAVPDRGLIHRTPLEFEDTWGPEGEVLLLDTTADTPQQRFGLSWFLPALRRYRWVLLEVLLASFFVQLFGLANPLMVQVIIDKVIVQNSIDTLQVLGIFLVIVAVFEAILSALRTYLFVDTTNRIDMALGSEIIDHLLRLPLRYFDRRPVGELASRVNELENIRQFLTGTALTVVLDAVFSVVYIIVMLLYSWQLTLLSLLTVPLFVLLTVLVSPIVRRQLRVKAERNAQTQSYLVEALSGIQTVKAQNIELRTRWQWQERYARYVSAGFNTVLTSTTAGAASNFLNKVSALVVLWAGAYFVLQGDLSLGQLIAFRIISGYVTAPLLRLAQLWQNFQETALSLERLSDILDHPREAEDQSRDQISMPDIQGRVSFENVSFRFAPTGPLQLANVSLEFPPGEFVGIVGQSGSGKSTLMKLLPRLYDVNSGRIRIDNYDISKVELYSLRQQVGIVPQDSLLFEGTVLENIALTRPEADTADIIAAAKVACAHDFIMDLPLGYESRVGERGSSLSGGQRQRLAIARTVLHNPNLLILDEATSALDYDTERQVCQNLKVWAKGRTVFFITHRLSTIQDADQILVMDRGAAVE